MNGSHRHDHHHITQLYSFFVRTELRSKFIGANFFPAENPVDARREVVLCLVVSIQTNHTYHFTSTQLRDYFFTNMVFFLIEPMLILHSWGRVS